eukprot:gene11255-23555_t
MHTQEAGRSGERSRNDQGTMAHTQAIQGHQEQNSGEKCRNSYRGCTPRKICTQGRLRYRTATNSSKLSGKHRISQIIHFDDLLLK